MWHAESPRLEPGQATQHQQNQQVRVLAALAHQLVQDVGDDQDSYQQAFGTRSICLPAVTCRYAPARLLFMQCLSAATSLVDVYKAKRPLTLTHLRACCQLQVSSCKSLVAHC